MANYKLLKRLERIIYLVKNNTGISKVDLLDRLLNDYDQEVGERTLERDFNALKKDYGLEIIYNRALRGYKLEEDPDRISAFFKFAEFLSLAELYKTGVKDFKQFQKWVIPDDSSAFKGLEHIKKTLEGITNAQKLSFKKINYYEGTEKEYTVTPLRLKEYLNRWYLIAIPDGLTEIRTFGLDRIENLKMLNEKGVRVKDEKKQLNQFSDVIGLNYSQSAETQKVILKADNKQLKYLRSMPLHHSQICIDGKNDQEWGTVTYELKPNYEFQIQILKMGDMVKVIEPKTLRDKIAKQVATMHTFYN